MRYTSSTAAASSPLLRRRRGILFGYLLIFVWILITEVDGGRGVDSNPFTPEGYLRRYWKKKVDNDLPKPEFLMEKASPLTAAQYAEFRKIASDVKSLSEKLPAFCEQANLLCSSVQERHDEDVDFVNYRDKNFSNYGNGRHSGTDEFRRYSENGNSAVDAFRRYSRGSFSHNDKFGAYAGEASVADQSFNSYGTGAHRGDGEFKNYNERVNVSANLRFTSYSDGSNGRAQSFSAYSDSANSGDELFESYGKGGNDADSTFTSYGKESKEIGSSFRNYAESANGGNDKFTSYGSDSNVPENTFSNYGCGGNHATDTFNNYRQQSVAGEDSFDSYGRRSNNAQMGFINYGQDGTDKFSGYGENANAAVIDFKIYGSHSSFKDYHQNISISLASFRNQSTVYGNDTIPATVDFSSYGVNNAFKEYSKEDTTTFSSYRNESTSMASGGRRTGKTFVEQGKFFREAMLKQGTLMPMPDIRDKMPRRSFLPRAIASKLPFSSSRISDINKIFLANGNSSISIMVTNALHECERAPSPGETKRCVASIEDMIDFATSVLGRSVAVRTTDATAGSNAQILLGEVKGINDGEVTQSVSCHQTLYPYLLYYCHSVPKVRVYEADILDPNTSSKINHGIAICHLDTTSWSPDHGAFIALGPGPGTIEVCHWIFENDMTWLRWARPNNPDPSRLSPYQSSETRVSETA